VSIASHQLRTPLSAIRWFLEMLLNGDMGKLKSEQKEVLEQTLISNNRMIALVNDMLNMARIESGTLKLCQEKFDFGALTLEVLGHIEPVLKTKKQVLSVKIPKKLPQVFADRKMIFHVVQNLVANASKQSV